MSGKRISRLYLVINSKEYSACQTLWYTKEDDDGKKYIRWFNSENNIVEYMYEEENT